MQFSDGVPNVPRNKQTVILVISNVNNKELILYALTKGITVDEQGIAYGVKGKPLAFRNGGAGYFQIAIKTPEGFKNLEAHRLAAYLKFGDAMFEPRIEVRHLDGNPLNNSADNLALGTHSDNILDIPKHVRIRTATTAAKAKRKLTDHEVAELRKDRAAGWKYKDLTVKYGLVKSALTYILGTGKRKAQY